MIKITTANESIVQSITRGTRLFASLSELTNLKNSFKKNEICLKCSFENESVLKATIFAWKNGK